MMEAPKILEHATSCKQPGRYIGWPTIEKGPEGTLYTVFSGDRDAHVCPFGKMRRMPIWGTRRQFSWMTARC